MEGFRESSIFQSEAFLLLGLFRTTFRLHVTDSSHILVYLGLLELSFRFKTLHEDSRNDISLKLVKCKFVRHTFFCRISFPNP